MPLTPADFPKEQPTLVDPGFDPAQLIVENFPRLVRDAICICNLTEVERKYALWAKNFPEVRPFYAIKCNPLPALCRAMYKLGSGFDCASPAEMRLALASGASPSEIIYANPQKTPASIREAYALGVDCFTFDSENELRKMLECSPQPGAGRFVMRLLPPDESASICRFGVKFGANRDEAKRLVKLCKQLGANLCGFSFHVGSGCGSTNSFKLAVQYLTEMSRYAHEEQGFELCLIDIGGGYMTKGAERHYDEINEAHNIHPPTFEQIAEVVNAELAKAKAFYNPEKLMIIAEPGRFFASDVLTLGIRVFGRRILFAEDQSKADAPITEEELLAKGTKITEVKFYVGDGLYGYFNAIFFDHISPVFRFVTSEGKPIAFDPKLARDESKQYGGYHLSHVFGPTCDSLDCVLQERRIPLLNVGDWLVADAFGAYTSAAATEFNGIPLVPIIYVMEKH